MWTENQQFEILYYIVAPHGGAEKNLTMHTQLQTIVCKILKKVHGLIAFLLAQFVALFTVVLSIFGTIYTYTTIICDIM